MNQTVLPKPFPSKENLLNRLKSLPIPMVEVIDVGVRESTSELIHAFPTLKHHLFEPVSLFFPDIERNYRRIDHVLHDMALSDTNETKFLIVKSLNKDGKGTHGQIVDAPVRVDGNAVLSCKELAVRRFDSLGDTFSRNALLKVDVDGLDLRVLRGFGERLSLASVVIVEMTYGTFSERAQYLTERGFQLFDLVDLVYYGAGLYQFDAAFVRRDLLTEVVRPAIQDFQRDLWQPLLSL